MRFRKINDQARPDVVAVLIFLQYVRLSAAVLLPGFDHPAGVYPDHDSELVHAIEPLIVAILHELRIVL